MQIQEHIPLAPFTTFRIGGPARFFTRVKNIEELEQAFGWARSENQKILILGGGSNVLLDDAGFNGLVVKIDLCGIERDGDTLVAGAGERWDALVARAINENLWGIENLSGIPGSVGGAVAGNIGAYGQALSQACAWVEAFDVDSGEIKKLSNAECKFGYRESIFSFAKTSTSLIILRGAFALSSAPQPDLSYKDLKERFADSSMSLHDIRDAVLTIRRAKFPDLGQEGTAGSFFKNPIVHQSGAAALQARYPNMPLFTMPETHGVKVPLAWILDHALAMRGERLGRARLFERQPLVVVAEKECSAREVLALARLVEEKIFGELKIKIKPEVKVIHS